MLVSSRGDGVMYKIMFVSRNKPSSIISALLDWGIGACLHSRLYVVDCVFSSTKSSSSASLAS